MNVLSLDKQATILTDLIERKSVRGLARSCRGNSPNRLRGLSPTTVMKLIADGGDTATQFLDSRMRKLPCRRIEIDEAYCIVGMNPRTARRRKLDIDGVGAVWLWLAIDAETKLVIAWRLGNRKTADCDAFIADLHSRLAGRVQITSDHLPRYPAAIDAAFGQDVDYARVKYRSTAEEEKRVQLELLGKHYTPPKLTAEQIAEIRYEDRPKRVIGRPNLDSTVATTNHIETFFSQLRRDIARMNRRTTLISKKVEYLRRVLALYFFHHNFIKKHYALGTTPAIAAGIDDDRWSWEDFTDLITEFRQSRSCAEKIIPRVVPVDANGIIHLPDQSGLVPDSPFCVFHSRVGEGYVKIHKSTCKHLRVGIGKQATKGVDRKLFCNTIEDAHSKAAELKASNTTVCKICLGQVRSLGYHDASRPKTRR